MKTTVEELHNRPLADIIADHNMNQEKQKQSLCENLLGPHYKYRYFNQTGLNYPEDNIMFL